MKIDDLYSVSDKNYYYLGVVSQVYRTNCVVQVENLTWLNVRRIRTEVYYPNSISYYVVIDSSVGIFIGEVYQNKFPDAGSVHKALLNEKYEDIFPDLSVDIKSVILGNRKDFTSVGFNSVGVTDKVYIANQKAVELYIKSLELSNNYNRDKTSKKLLNFANNEQFDNVEINLYPETLFDRHLMVIGSTNSGKSTTSLSILDSMLKANKKLLVIDPTGEYKDSFALECKNNIMKKCVLGIDTFIDPSKVLIKQWCDLFETNNESQPAILSAAIKSLKYRKGIENNDDFFKKDGQTVSDITDKLSMINVDDNIYFDIEKLPQQIINEAVVSRKNGNTIVYNIDDFRLSSHDWLVQKIRLKLSNQNFSKLFKIDNKQDNNLFNMVDSFLNDDVKDLYIDASQIAVNDNIGRGIIDVICNYIINQSVDIKKPFVIFVDEVHRYTKDTSNSGYQTALTNIAREGRKKGIYLFLTTQSPQDVPDILLSQVGSLIVHRLTHKNELDAIRNHVSEDLLKIVPKLTQGEAVLTSINLLSDLKIKVKKCNRSHDNQTKML